MSSDSNEQHTATSLQNTLVLAAVGAIPGAAIVLSGVLAGIYFDLFGETGDNPGEKVGGLILAIVMLLGLIVWGAKGAKRIGGRVALIAGCVAGAVGGCAFAGIEHLLRGSCSPWAGAVGAVCSAAVISIVKSRKGPAE